MITFYVFLLVVGAIGAGAYLLLFFSHVPGAKDERLGVLEALPSDLGEWVKSDTLEEDGSVKETRYLLSDPSSTDTSKLIKQTRFREPTTGEILRIDPESTYKRRRHRN